MTFTDYQKMAARTINRELTDTQIERHALFGLASEVGELLGLYQKVYQGHEIEEEHFIKEAGDILWMLAELMTATGYDLEEVARKNIDKLLKRYPDGFSAENSKHRAEGDV